MTVASSRERTVLIGLSMGWDDWIYSLLLLFCLQARVLDSVGWDRVDIFNQDGLSPYKDLVVANEWLNGQGADIVRHIINHALNRPPETKQTNALVVVAEDLITGLTDDEEQDERKTAV